MSRLSWFKLQISLPTSYGMQRLERVFGKHQALSMWIRTLCYLVENSNYVVWSDEETCTDFCQFVHVSRAKCERFIDELIAIRWLSEDMWKTSNVICSKDLQQQIDIYSARKRMAKHAREQRKSENNKGDN